MGWRDFRSADRPETADVVAMACEAFVYLSINEDGHWNGTVNVLTAIKRQTAHASSSEDLRRLAALLRARPVSVDDFFEYFHGDNGAGIGASHQTGWTGLVAKIIEQSGA
ncbi:MAG: hypothetical protein Q9191_008547 [Dirinaria sp. TL-2023a]